MAVFNQFKLLTYTRILIIEAPCLNKGKACWKGTKHSTALQSLEAGLNAVIAREAKYQATLWLYLLIGWVLPGHERNRLPTLLFLHAEPSSFSKLPTLHCHRSLWNSPTAAQISRKSSRPHETWHIVQGQEGLGTIQTGFPSHAVFKKGWRDWPTATDFKLIQPGYPSVCQ